MLVKGYTVDFESIVKRVTETVDEDSRNIERSLRSVENPKLFKESCRFIGPKTLQVGKEVVQGEKILLASGGRPKVLELEGLEGSGYITSDEALRLKRQPRVLTILGGGYIAAEMAHFFGSLGTKVTIVQRADLLVPNEDEEIAKEFTKVFSEKYSVLTGSEPVKVSREGATFKVIVKRVKDGSSRTLSSDQLLVAVGRVPNSDTLDLGKTGVKTDARGFVVTDDYLETNVKGIFALGDAVGHYLFRHSANLEAEYDFNNLLDTENKIAVDYSAMPHAVFSSPQIAGVGKMEQQLRAEGADYVVGRYKYIDTAMGKAIEDNTGFVKFLIERKTRKILGCHVIGSDAATLIHEAVVAMKSGEGTVGNILRAVHVHPALSEVVQRAAASAR